MPLSSSCCFDALFTLLFLLSFFFSSFSVFAVIFHFYFLFMCIWICHFFFLLLFLELVNAGGIMTVNSVGTPFNGRFYRRYLIYFFILLSFVNTTHA